MQKSMGNNGEEMNQRKRRDSEGRGGGEGFEEEAEGARRGRIWRKG